MLVSTYRLLLAYTVLYVVLQIGLHLKPQNFANTFIQQQCIKRIKSDNKRHQIWCFLSTKLEWFLKAHTREMPAKNSALHHKNK